MSYYYYWFLHYYQVGGTTKCNDYHATAAVDHAGDGTLPVTLVPRDDIKNAKSGAWYGTAQSSDSRVAGTVFEPLISSYVVVAVSSFIFTLSIIMNNLNQQTLGPFFATFANGRKK